MTREKVLRVENVDFVPTVVEMPSHEPQRLVISSNVEMKADITKTHILRDPAAVEPQKLLAAEPLNDCPGDEIRTSSMQWLKSVFWKRERSCWCWTGTLTGSRIGSRV